MSTKVEKTIKKCQEEVKIELIEDTLQLYNEYRENLEVQLHAQAHAIANEQPHHETLEVVPDFPIGDGQEVPNYHPDFYTTQGFEDSNVEASEKKAINKVQPTPKMAQGVSRARRDASSEWFHPTLISHEDKWIAGVIFFS